MKKFVIGFKIVLTVTAFWALGTHNDMVIAISTGLLIGQLWVGALP